MIDGNKLIVNLPSSFVSTSRKLKSDKGNGEAKLYIGNKKEENIIDSFFDDFNSENKYKIDILKIKTFFLKLYLEFNFEIFNEYKQTDKKAFFKILDQLDKLPNEKEIDIHKYADKTRYYIRSIHNKKIWDFLLRTLPLPKITNLVITRERINYFEISLEINDNINQSDTQDNLNDNTLNDEELNKIYYGAPGTGKSYTLNSDAKIFGNNIKRVTFHPNLIYGNFVGSYKPIPTKDPNVPISYGYVPGPLIKILVKAFKNPSQSYLLIIEEINRANTAAVFGEIFQLLDRNQNGFSEYPVDISEELMTYFKSHLFNDENIKEDVSQYINNTLENGLVLPSNLYIWATMNSADQGVMPLDTAFKRRWDFKYFGVNDAYDEQEFKNYGKINLGNGKRITWDNMRRFINDKLSLLNIPEDKLLGPYFLSKNILTSSNKKVTDAFINKVIMYLFEDLGVHNRMKIFSGDILRYSNIVEDFKQTGEKIFNFSDELENLIEKPSTL